MVFLLLVFFLQCICCHGWMIICPAPSLSFGRSSFTVSRGPFVAAVTCRATKQQHDDESTATTRFSSDDNDNMLQDDDEELVPPELPPLMDVPLSQKDLETFTLKELQQQLRLRGLKVSGRKHELQKRLIVATGGVIETKETAEKKAVNVTAYLDEGDQDNDFKSIGTSSTTTSDEQDDLSSSTSPEVWGAEARMVDDYDDGQIVVDGLSRSKIEYQGSNQSSVEAYVVASRDALRPFLAGLGLRRNQTSNSNTTSEYTITRAEERLLEIQQQRERASRRRVSMEDQVGVEEGDETGIYANILHRDFSDWGKYTATGAQLSAQEVQGVLLLSDIYGAFSDDTKTLANKIAFECQPVVVIVPDLFRGEPWTDSSTREKNDKGQSYEEWRTQHSDLRVSVDIRAAAACLRERYGVSSVVVWGMCYGGGRALEAASGWVPNGSIHDVDGSVGPPPVDPMAAVAWYPTRYYANDLFGKQRKGSLEALEGRKRKMAVMVVFAGEDKIAGATKEDAALLKSLLEDDERVHDYMVKVFPGQDHGFAHHGLSQADDADSDDFMGRFVDEEFGGAGRVSMGGGDAEVACLLSTAFMETYSRVFLPSVGAPISRDENAKQWNRELELTGLEGLPERDVRQELQEEADNFVEEPLGGYRIDPGDESQEEELIKLLRSMEDPEAKNGPYAINEDDDLSTIYGKLIAADDNFEIF